MSDPSVLKQASLWLWRATFFTLLLAVTAFCLAKLPPSEPLINDKIQHFIAFAALAVPCAMSWPLRRFFPLLAVALIAYGAAIEFTQHFLPWRSAEWLDLLADAAGVVAGGVAIMLWRQRSETAS